MVLRDLYIVQWRKVRESTQAERDFLYFYTNIKSDDGTYLLNEELFEELETALEDDPPKEKELIETYSNCIKSLRELYEKEGEVSIIIS